MLALGSLSELAGYHVCFPPVTGMFLLVVFFYEKGGVLLSVLHKHFSDTPNSGSFRVSSSNRYSSIVLLCI
jgi:hypothetical protein